MTGIGAKDCDGVLIPVGRESIQWRGEMYLVDGNLEAVTGWKAR